MKVSMISLMDDASPQWLELSKGMDTIGVGKTNLIPNWVSGTHAIEGMNKAITKLGETDLVVLMPSNAIPHHPAWLNTAIQMFRDRPMLGGVDFYLVTQDKTGPKILHGGGGYSGREAVRYREGEKPENLAPHESGWISLMGCVIRKAVLDQVGLLHYTPDWEARFGQEASRYGWKFFTLGAPIELPKGMPKLSETVCPVSWRGPVSDSSGYTAEGRQLLDWFPPAFPVRLHPIAWGIYYVRMNPLENERLQKLMSTTPAEIVVHHGFPTMFEKLGKYDIGRTMYETDRLNPDWQAGLKIVDEVWTPSSFCQTVLGKYHPNVQIIPSPIDVDIYRPLDSGFGSLMTGNKGKGIPSKSEVCRFLFVSEWIKRKGWRELCRAFCDAFTDEPVELVFKTYSSFRKPVEVIHQEMMRALPGKQFRFIHGILTEEELSQLYNSCHCLAHPAHGEGFGRTVAEALACGIEAISIGETGLKEIQRYPIQGTQLVEVPLEAYDEMWHSTEGGHQWVDIPHEALVAELRASYERWSNNQVRSDRQWIVDNFSGPVVSSCIHQRLAQIVKKERL